MVSVFNPTFRDTLNLSLSQLTGAYMLGTFLASLPQSYIGHWADRLGIRKMLFIIVSLFSLACVFMAQVNNLVMLFIASGATLEEIINFELVTEEIIRTLIGSIGLVLAVPITSLIASILIAGKETQRSFRRLER